MKIACPFSLRSLLRQFTFFRWINLRKIGALVYRGLYKSTLSVNQRKKDKILETRCTEFFGLICDTSLKEPIPTLQSLVMSFNFSSSQESWCSSKPLQYKTRENNFKSFPLFQGNKFSQHEYYLSGRIHRGPSSQQLLNQAHVALLGSQVESIESILKGEANKTSEVE